MKHCQQERLASSSPPRSCGFRIPIAWEGEDVRLSRNELPEPVPITMTRVCSTVSPTLSSGLCDRAKSGAEWNLLPTFWRYSAELWNRRKAMGEPSICLEAGAQRDPFPAVPQTTNHTTRWRGTSYVHLTWLARAWTLGSGSIRISLHPPLRLREEGLVLMNKLMPRPSTPEGLLQGQN